MKEILEKWFPFGIVNVVLIYLISNETNNTWGFSYVIILTVFDFFFFSLYDRLKFDKFNFILSKKGLQIVFDKVVERYQKHLDNIDYEAIGVKVDKVQLKRDLSKAKDISELTEMISQSTYSYTLEAVKAKRNSKTAKAIQKTDRDIFKTKAISSELDEIFQEQ